MKIKIIKKPFNEVEKISKPCHVLSRQDLLQKNFIR